MAAPTYLYDDFSISPHVTRQNYVDNWGSCDPADAYYGTNHFTASTKVHYAEENPALQALAAREAALAQKIDETLAYLSSDLNASTVDVYKYYGAPSLITTATLFWKRVAELYFIQIPYIEVTISDPNSGLYLGNIPTELQWVPAIIPGGWELPIYHIYASGGTSAKVSSHISPSYGTAKNNWVIRFNNNDNSWPSGTCKVYSTSFMYRPSNV